MVELGKETRGGMVKQDPDFSELVQEARRGCRYSVNKLVVAAQPRMLAFFLRTTLNPELSEDLTQETLLTLLARLTHLEKPESFWPWLYRVAWSKLQQHFRHQNTHATVPLSELDDCRPVSKERRPDALQLLIHQEMIGKLHRAMNTLQDRQRELIDMRCFRQMSYAAIARQQQCGIPQARVRYFRVKESLRQMAEI